MEELTNKQIERQDFVDNSIFELIQNLNPSNKEIEWDIEFIAEIRDIIQLHFNELGVCSEQEFYPFNEE